MLVVGHNDPGYLPDVDPVEVPDLATAIQVLMDLIIYWFEPELDGEELNQYDLSNFLARARQAQKDTSLILRGHAFWIH